MPRPLRLAALPLLVASLLLAAHPLPQTGAIDGTIRDAETGDALPGANVYVVGTSLGAAADAAGRFRIADVPRGAAELRATLIGYEPATATVDVPDGGVTSVVLTLVPAAEAPEEVVVEGEYSRSSGVVGSARASDAAAPPAPPPADVRAEPGRRSEGSSRDAASRSRLDRDREADDGRRSPVRSQPGLLTAGDIDDGLNWPAYLGYVRRAIDGDRQRRRRHAFPDLSLEDRVELRVVDRAGHPVAGARVTVEGAGGSGARRLVTEAGTDGRLALFPHYDFGRGTHRLTVRVQAPGGQGRAHTETVRLGRLGGDRMVRVELPIRVAERPRALDLAFVIDVTGSMGDELRYLTDEFESIVERVERRNPGVDLRFGLVAYRDRGDQFVVRRSDFTRSAPEMQRRLAALRASGGGDYPEAMDEALVSALGLDWRTGTAARVVFLVADAPPHDDRVDRTMAAVREARARGIRLYPVAASGVADEAEYVMRAAAVLTQARHLFLTDDSGVGLPHAEPKIACYQVTALDNLLVRVVASELEGRRVEASRHEVIREVGDYDAGVCEAPVVVQRPQRRLGQGDRLGYVDE